MKTIEIYKGVNIYENTTKKGIEYCITEPNDLLGQLTFAFDDIEDAKKWIDNTPGKK